MSKSRTNKSQSIREYLSVNPVAKPKDVIKALAKKHIRVSPQLVSAIKGRSSGRTRTDRINMRQLLAAKSLVDQVGGIGEARKALEMIAKLQ